MGDEAFDVRRRDVAGRNKRAAVMTAENRTRAANEGRRSKYEGRSLFVARGCKVAIVLVR